MFTTLFLIVWLFIVASLLLSMSFKQEKHNVQAWEYCHAGFIIDLNLDANKNDLSQGYADLTFKADETSYTLLNDSDHLNEFKWESSDYIVYYDFDYGFNAYPSLSIQLIDLSETITQMSRFETDTYKFVRFDLIIPNEIENVEQVNTTWDSVTWVCYWGADSFGGYVVKAVWQEATSITLNKNGGTSGDDSFTVSGTTPAVTSIKVPTRDGYKFLGYYDTNGVQYVDEDGNVNQTASLYTTIPSELTAKWIESEITLTLNHTNYSDQRYMIYIYQGENLIMQIMSQSDKITLKLPYIDYTNTKYYVQFVYNSCGSIEYTTLTNATQVNRHRLEITTFANTTISYKLNCISLVGIII